MTITSPNFDTSRVGILGLGNVGLALGRGLSQARHHENTRGYDKNAARRQRFSETAGLKAVGDCESLIDFADVLVLCVRTDQVLPSLEQICSHLSASKTVLCMAAAVQLSTLRDTIGLTAAIVRAIPNVNMATGHGLTIVLRDATNRSNGAFDKVIDLLGSVGEVIVTDSEPDLDRLSVLSGCAPAAVAIFFEALCHFGTMAGFSDSLAREVAIQCISASLETIRTLNVDASAFKNSVAAPGGIVHKLLDSPQSTLIHNATVEWLNHILQKITGGARRE